MILYFLRSVKGMTTVTMDKVILRTPHLAVAIFAEVDNTTLANCNIISETWGSFIDVKKVKWLRIILKYAGNMTEFADQWKVLLRRTSVKIVKEIALLVEEFFCANAKRKDYQWSPFVIAADRGNLELYQYTLYKLNQRNFAQVDHTKALEFATMGSHLECCKFIIANVTEKNLRKSKSMKFCLHWAARYGHLEVFKLLIENTSDKNPSWNFGWTPLHEAASGGHLNCVYSALEHNGAMPMDIAAKNGHLEICKFLIMNIADKNPSNVYGMTALHVAARFNQLEACNLIMKSVVDKNPLNQSGRTPLHLAAKAGHLEICRLLIDSVVDKNPGDNMRWTPLGEAISGGHVQVCKLIMDNLEEDVDKERLVGIAVEYSHFELCEFLIDGEKGSNCNPISQLFFFTLLMIMFPKQFLDSKISKWRTYGFFVSLLLATFPISICGFYLTVAIFWDQMNFWVQFYGLCLFHFVLWIFIIGPILQSSVKRMKGLKN